MGGTFSIKTVFLPVDKMTPFFKKASGAAGGFGSVLKGILSANLIQAGFQKLKQGAMSFVTEAQKIEDATAAFTPLLGGVEKATQLVNRLNTEAATTPFQFEGISNVAKQLLPVMNGNIEATASTFRMLGDTAGGNIQKLDSITRGYTKALLKGKPDMEALNMIAEAGVPIFTEMSRTMGITVAELTQLSSKGKLTNADLTKTFQNMTNEGGIFFNGMQIASQTLTGRISTLKDNISLTAATIGGAFQKHIKNGVGLLTDIVSGVRTWVTANKELIGQKIDAFVIMLKNSFQQITPTILKVFTSIQNFGSVVFGTIKDIFSAITGGVDPVNSSLNILESILNGVSSAADFLSGIIKSVVGFFKNWYPMIIAITAAIIAYNAAVAITSILTNKVAIMTKLWSGVQAVLNFIMSINPIGLIIAGIIILIGIITMLIKHWDKVKVVFENVFNFIKGVFQAIGSIGVSMWDGLKEGLFNFWDTIVSVFNGVKNFVIGIWNKIKAPFEAVGGFFKKLFGGNNAGSINEENFKNAQSSSGIEPPNKAETESRPRAQWEGNLNIAGAPEGSTFEQKSKGAPPMRYQMMGAN